MLAFLFTILGRTDVLKCYMYVGEPGLMWGALYCLSEALHVAIWSFKLLSVFIVMMLSSAFLRSCLKFFNVNSFFRAVTVTMASCFAILLISFSVLAGSGVFCMRVMAKTVSKVWLLNGGWPASARRSATF